MEGLSRAAGVGPTVKLGGRSLTVSGKILRHYAEIEAEVIKARGNPFDLMRQLGEAMPDREDLAYALVGRAFTEAKSWRFVTLGEIGSWLDDTMRGRCFRTWLAVRDNDPQTLTLEAVSTLYADEFESLVRTQGIAAAEKWDAAICQAIDAAEGADELGNSNTSPTSTREAAETASSPGTSSTAGSPTSEAGDPAPSIA